MSGYFASFPEWPKRFELVTGEDGCRVSLISGDEDISANNNTLEAQNGDQKQSNL
jgi:hypothetical protein